MTGDDFNELYQLVALRGADRKKPFIWEIRRRLNGVVIQVSNENFASLSDAHRSGLEALSRMPAVRRGGIE